MMHRVLISELLKRGHEITMITALTLEPQKLDQNYTEILIEPEFDSWQIVRNVTGKTSIYDMSNDFVTLAKVLELVGLGTTEYALKQPKVQAIINAKQTKGVYDFLLVEQ
ncbi:uncharacterized protein [Eurosta solidaginis]|uniref:uncharacterized protein n=1 Tax=Eurosta solidaginis TaxID=178769 RepID=UPI0035313350